MLLQEVEETHKTKYGIYIPAMILDSKFQPGNSVVNLFNWR